MGVTAINTRSSPQEAITPARRLTGSFTVTLDGKGRFMLPAKFRRVLPPRTPLYLSVMSDRLRENKLILVLFPESAWVTKRDSLSSRQREAFANLSYTIRTDSQGRINIPEAVKEHFGVRAGEKLVLSGCGDYITIRKQADWKEITPPHL